MMRRPPASASLILAATVISGAAGYAATWLVAGVVTPALYTGFAALWSVQFLIVGALAGVQQVVTRATVPSPRRDGARASVFAVAAAAIVGALLIATSGLWAPGSLGELWLNWPVIVGSVGYVLVASFCGVLYGARA